MYSPNKPFKVYNQEEWWGDDWDPLSYGREYDFTRPFFEQFRELQLAVPRVSLTNTNSENSLYTNYTANNKNCYLIFSNSYGHNEDCYYGTCLSKSKSCVDSFNITGCELCFDCIDCTHCYRLVASRDCIECNDSYFLSDCKGCKDCIACSGLRNKQHCILNIQYSKDEYLNKLTGLSLHTRNGYQQTQKLFEEQYRKIPHIYSRQKNCENSTGDYLQNSRNCVHCFDTNKSEDCSFLQYSVGDDHHCYDSCYLVDSKYCYENLSLVQCEKNFFTNLTWWGVYNAYYCELCFNNSHDIFGCIGLRKKEYCILNKQYTKTHYEEIVPRIIQHMISTKEFGEFFPLSLSPFSYNETVAHEYFPLTEEQAAQLGTSWLHDCTESKYYGKQVQLPNSITDTTDGVLLQFFTCDTCKKYYRIIKQELVFYRAMQLPIPTNCPNCRHEKRMQLRNPRKLWDRNCTRCHTTLQSTYAPERTETVYCEQCYMETIY